MKVQEKVTGWIPDGHNFSGFIKGIDRLFPDLRFTYRQATTQARAAIRHSIDLATNDPLKVETIGAQTIKAHVLDWDLKKPDGSTVPLTVSDILRVQAVLERTIYRIVMGDQAPDEDPKLQNEERDQAAADALLAALAGHTVEEQGTKNSGKG